MHRTSITVRFADLDLYGHVNHATYLSYFETARVEALADIGFGIDRLHAEGVLLVVVEVRIRYRRPATLGQTLAITTEVKEMRRRSSAWHQVAAHDGEVVAEADMRGAVTDLAGRLRPHPDDFAEALASLG